MKDREGIHKHKREQGVALMLVMMSITLLSAIMVTFTFDTKINKIKAVNLQEKAQARLNAETGLHLAVTRLALYAEAFNKRQQAGEGAEQMVSNQMLNQIWQYPFMLPIPDLPGLNQSLKSSIKAFNEESFIEGKMNLSIKNISNRYNLNALRIHSGLLFDAEGNDRSEKVYAAKSQIIDFYTQMVRKKLRELAQSNPEMIEQVDQHIDDIPRLFDQIIYFISEEGLADALFRRGLPSVDFADQGLSRKFGPLSSKSELFLLPAWDDFIVKHIGDLFTIHNTIAPDETGKNIVSSVIDLNTLSEDHLVTLFEMNIEEARRFLELKNDPTKPVFFKSPEDFISFASNDFGLISEGEIQQKFESLQELGVIFETYSSLFEVTSSGIKGQTRYTVKSYVSTPVKLPPPPPNKKEQCLKDEQAQWFENEDPQCICPDGKKLMNNECVPESTPESNADQLESPGQQQPQQTDKKTQLMPPIVFEVFLT